MIKSTTTNNENFAFWNVRIYDFKEGELFKIRLRAKTEDMSGNGFQVNMFGRGANFTQTDIAGIGDEIVDTDDEWKTIEVAMNAPISEDVKHIDIYMLLLGNTKGTVYFDKLEVISE